MPEVRFDIDAENADAVRGFREVTRAQKKLESQTDSVDQKTKRMSKNGSRGMKKWNRSARNMVSTYVGIEAAINAATDAFRHYRSIRKKAAQEEVKSFKSWKDLGQVATSDKDLERMLKDTEKSMVEGVMSKREAGALQFMLESSGKENKRQFYAQLATIADSKGMAESVTTLQNALGTSETGMDKALVEKLFTASSVAKTNVGQIASGATRAAQSVKSIGATDEGLLASMAIGSKGEATVERVSTRIAGMASQAKGSELLPDDKGILGVVRAAKKLEQGGKPLQEIFSERRARQGYKLLRDNLEKIEKLQKRIGKKGQSAAAVKTMFGATTAKKINAMRKKFGTALQKERTDIRKTLARQNRHAEGELTMRTLLDAYETEQENARVDNALIAARDKILEARKFTNKPEDLLVDMAQWSPKIGKKLARRFGYELPEQMGTAESVARTIAPATTGLFFGHPTAHKRAGQPEGLLVETPEATSKSKTPNVVAESDGNGGTLEVKYKNNGTEQRIRNGGSNGIE